MAPRSSERNKIVGGATAHVWNRTEQKEKYRKEKRV
jgi:hypothetical protein